MTLCTRCSQHFEVTAVESYLAACGLSPLPRMDQLCRILAKQSLHRAKAATHPPHTAAWGEWQALSVLQSRQRTRRYTPEDVLTMVALWAKQHGRLPSAEDLRHSATVGVSCSVVYRLFPGIVGLYGACLDAGICTEQDIRAAMRSANREQEYTLWANRRRRRQHAE